MASTTPPEQPWSNHEKNYLLAEIIKSANPPPHVLFDAIRDLNIQPRWDDTPLPPGRSLRSCRYAFDELRRSLSAPMPAPVAPNTPTPLAAALPSLKRSYQFDPPTSTYQGPTSGREIRPKPSTVNPPFSLPSPTDQPPLKRKRGRPTKAEALAKAEAAAASSSGPSEPGPTSMFRAPPPPHPPPPPPPPPSQPTPHPATVPVLPPEELKPGPHPTTTRMPIAAMLTPTAHDHQPTASPSHSDSSSARRRRARSTKSDVGESPGRRPPAVPHDYESPYPRPDAPDTPARAAVLRHQHHHHHRRDDPDGSTPDSRRPSPTPTGRG